jgi:hypothetical protein
MKATMMIAAFCVAGCAQQAHAQALVDPTRPPSATTDPETARAAGPVLQSVLIGRGRNYAVIDGHIVKLGAMYAGARLVAISESEVTLRTGADVKVLRLFPGIDKKSTAGATSPARAARAEGRP